MSTPLREATLTCCNLPNTMAKHVQDEIAKMTCPIVTKSGVNKGKVCGKRFTFDAEEGFCICPTRQHTREAYEQPYGNIIFDIINAVPDEKQQEFYKIDGGICVCAASEEEERQKKIPLLKKRSQEMANTECEVLGLDTGVFHMRPDGAAPDGKTWSFRLGEWIEPEQLKKRAKIDE